MKMKLIWHRLLQLDTDKILKWLDDEDRRMHYTIQRVFIDNEWTLDNFNCNGGM